VVKFRDLDANVGKGFMDGDVTAGKAVKLYVET
jgi:hypothetical protein